MIWGVSTGRAGTRSIAADLGGIHEPQPWLLGEAVRAYHGDEAAREITLAKLAARAGLDTPAVVDLKHSVCIPMIRVVDPLPGFAWVVRNPIECVASLVAGGWWSERDFYGRHVWSPMGGWPQGMRREEKAARYWYGVNNLLLREWSNRPADEEWTIRRTDSLTHHENRYPDKARVTLSTADAAMVMDLCGSVWSCIRDLTAAPLWAAVP